MRIIYRTILTAIALSAMQNAAAQSGDLKHPDWHPDGRLIVSEGSCTGDVGLYLVDTVSGDVSLLFDGEHTDGYPRWFSDGERVAFHQIDARRESKIYIATVSVAGEISDITAVTEGPFDIEPAPSPDGTQMAFSAIGSRGQDIALVQLGSGRRKVWETLEAENFPSWHPDGGSLFFHAEESENTQIYQRLLSTYQISNVTRGRGPNLMANVSNDATQLAFNSERTGDREIYTRKLSGGEEVRLTNRVGRDGYPKFSPDGKRIAYHSEIEDARAIIRVLDLETSETLEFACDNMPDPEQ